MVGITRSRRALREMLPGSFVERRRRCGKPTCHCADGKRLHTAFQISVLLNSKLKTFHIPAELAEETRSKVELHRRFQDAAAAICQINLHRFLRHKGQKEKRREEITLRRHQFESCLDKVFDFSAKVDALPEGHPPPRHDRKKIFDAVFLVAACKFSASHRIERLYPTTAGP
jgi:hypothetical protein